jgi:hypothetical protein
MTTVLISLLTLRVARVVRRPVEDGNIIQEAPLPVWANLRQRALECGGNFEHFVSLTDPNRSTFRSCVNRSSPGQIAKQLSPLCSECGKPGARSRFTLRTHNEWPGKIDRFG